MFDAKKKEEEKRITAMDVGAQLNSDERRPAASSSACQIEYQLPLCKFSLSLRRRRRCVMCKSSENGSNRKKRTVAILVEKKRRKIGRPVPKRESYQLAN